MNFPSTKTRIFFQTLSYLLLIFNIPITSSFRWDGNVLYDLEATTLAGLDVEAAPWILSSYKTAGVKVNQCGSYFLLGGYNILAGAGTTGALPYYGQYFQRTYTSLPPHNQIYIKMLFLQIDSWDGPTEDDHFDIVIDGVATYAWRLNLLPDYYPNICGPTLGWKDGPFFVYMAAAHSATSLTLKIVSYGNEDSSNESIGFRDIQIDFVATSLTYFSLCSVNGYGLPASRCLTSCTGTQPSMSPAGSGFCYPSSCSSNCKTCSGNSNLCTSCQAGWSLVNNVCYPTCNSPLFTEILGGNTYCKTPCSGLIAWWDQSCSSACSYTTSYGSYPIVGTLINTFQQCTFPCGVNQYLYWNTSCLDSCPDPLIGTPYKSRNFCEYPCLSTQFLYWNGSCLNTCPSPLQSETQGTSQQRKFCWYPCSESQYLYWNGSCLSTCSLPLQSEIQIGTILSRKFCWYPCQPTQYLYWNGSCINTCPSPLSPQTQGASQLRNFCWYTCSESQYLYWNGSCLNTCPFPLQSETQIGTTSSRKFCWYPCQPTQHLYWNGSCIGTCPLPLSSEIQGVSQSRNFCWYPCLETEYLYWNGSCLNLCPSPLVSETQVGTGSSRKFCWYSCQATQYLYWNGSCTNTCPSPFNSETQGSPQTRNFCWSPCEASQYIYWNRSCLSDCPSPLVQNQEPQIQLCINPCGETSSDFLYKNQSCISTCPYPLSSYDKPGVHYCVNPCDDTPSFPYLYENQTCLSHCVSPFLPREEPSDIKYCDRPCSHPNIYWYKNSTCLPECKTPYLQINNSGVIQCLSPCLKDSDYFYNHENVCRSQCKSPYTIQKIDVIQICHFPPDISQLEETIKTIELQESITSTGLKASSAINPSSPTSAILAGLASMMQYIRYMKVNYPPKVQTFFMLADDTPISLSFNFDLPPSIEEQLIDNPLPEVFDRYDINSNFIYNLWDFLATVALILIIILLFSIFKQVLTNFSKINFILEKVLQTLKWNIPIMMICSSSGDIFFYSSLQMRSSSLNSTSSVLCFIVSLFMIALVTLIFFMALTIVKNFHKYSQAGSPRNQSDSWKEKWKGYEILFEEYEEKSLFSLAYMALFIIRGIIFNLTLTLLFDYPLLQCVIINLANFLMFGYLLYLRPLKDLLGTIQLFINEGFMNALMICVLILASMDKAGLSGRKTRVEIGTVILIIIQAFSVFALIFMGLSILLFLVSMYKKWRYLKAHKTKPSIAKIFKMLVFGSPKNGVQKIIPETSLDSQQAIEKMTITTISETSLNPHSLDLTKSKEKTSQRTSTSNIGGSVTIFTEQDPPLPSIIERSILQEDQPSFYFPKGRKISEIQGLKDNEIQENHSQLNLEKRSEISNVARETTEISLFTDPKIRPRVRRESIFESWKRVKDRERRSSSKIPPKTSDHW